MQQKALPFAVLDELTKRQVTETDKSITQLTIGIGAAFFACRRSCEYTKVPRREQKCTRLMCLRNVRFFRDGLLMPTQSNDLESADSVAIIFEMQKNDLNHDTVIHGRMDDSVLCPVLQWACLVNRIWTYPGASLDTPVCTVWRKGCMDHITSKNILSPAITLQLIWKRLPRLRTSQSGYPLVAIRSSNGNVSWGNPRLHHHAHWHVVERCFFLLQPKTGGAILAQRCEEDADLLIFPSYPGHCSPTNIFRRPPAAQSS